MVSSSVVLWVIGCGLLAVATAGQPTPKCITVRLSDGGSPIELCDQPALDDASAFVIPATAYYSQPRSMLHSTQSTISSTDKPMLELHYRKGLLSAPGSPPTTMLTKTLTKSYPIKTSILNQKLQNSLLDFGQKRPAQDGILVTCQPSASQQPHVKPLPPIPPLSLPLPLPSLQPPQPQIIYEEIPQYPSSTTVINFGNRPQASPPSPPPPQQPQQPHPEPEPKPFEIYYFPAAEYHPQQAPSSSSSPSASYESVISMNAPRPNPNAPMQYQNLRYYQQPHPYYMFRNAAVPAAADSLNEIEPVENVTTAVVVEATSAGPESSTTPAAPTTTDLPPAPSTPSTTSSSRPVLRRKA